MIQIVGNQLTQWDVGRLVEVTGDAEHVHFANQGDSKAVIIEIEEGQAKIPEYLLQTGKTVLAYAVLDGVTLESYSFPVRKRERPEKYVYEDDTRNYIYELISDAEKAIEEAAQAAQDAITVANQAAAVAEEAGQSADASAGVANQAAETANEAAEVATEAAKTAKSFVMIGKTEGTAIYLDDTADQYLYSGKVFGKTTQSGVPSPAAPIPLVSAGDGSIQIRTAGKNLLQCSAASTTSRGITFSVAPDGTILVNGTATENAYLTIGQVTLHPGRYFLSGNLSGSSTTHRIFITNGTNEYNNYTADREFTVTETGTWSVRILINTGTTVSNLKLYPMVRLATIVDSNYERYKSATEAVIATPNGLHGIPVTSGGNYTDANGQQWICDEIDFARGVYVKRIQKDVFDGTENWSYFNSGNNPCFTTTTQPATRNAAMSSHFEHSNYPYTLSIEKTGFFGWDSSNKYLYFASAYSSVADWKAWLATNHVTVIYALATPIETPLSAEEIDAFGNLRTYRGHTTISNSGNAHMEIEYVMDAKKYIDSLIGTGGSSSGTILPATVE